jgi:alkyl hydroperoxide reductase subunit F
VVYDLIIIGAGPAGITAAVYAARKRMNLLVITNDIGGQTALTSDIENYTGYQFITGPELASKFEEHMKKYGISVMQNESVTGIDRKANAISIKTEKTSYEAKAAIIASGAKWKKLGVPGEKEFKNKGLTYCATCDGPLFGGKDVAVVGGGNSGLQAAIQLMKIAGHVYLIEIGPRLTADKIVQEKIAANKKTSILTNTEVKAVLGDKLVTGLKIKEKSGERVLSVQGVFVETGLFANSEFAETLDKNKKGEIKIDSRNRTNIPGIFAAGDVTDVPEKQIIIAAGEGAKATLSAFKYLAHLKS